MHDIDHALSVIAEKLSIPKLSLNGNGQAEIAFADGLSIFVTRIEPTIAEMSIRLEGLDFADPAMMRAMLEANCLGAGTGAGRLGIDAGKGEAYYSERWNVDDIDAAKVEARFAALVQYGAFWKTEGTDLLVAEAETQKPADAPPEAFDGGAPEMILRA